MCVVSMIGDHYGRRFREMPLGQPVHSATTVAFAGPAVRGPQGEGGWGVSEQKRGLLIFWLGVVLLVVCVLHTIWLDHRHSQHQNPHLTWLCIKIDDVPSALGLEPNGEGSISFGLPGDPSSHLMTVHFCSEREAKTLFVVLSEGAKPHPPASADRK